MPTFKIRVTRRVETTEFADVEIEAEDADSAVACAERAGEVGLPWQASGNPSSVTVTHEVTEPDGEVSTYLDVKRWRH